MKFLALIFFSLIFICANAQTTHLVTNQDQEGEGSLKYCIQNSADGDIIKVSSNLKELALIWGVKIEDKTLTLDFNNVPVTNVNWISSQNYLLYTLMDDNHTLKVKNLKVDGFSNSEAIFDLWTNKNASIEFVDCTFLNQKNPDRDVEFIFDISNKGSLTFNNCDFKNNVQPCFLIDNEGIVKINECNFVGNEILVGQVYGGEEITITNCLFQGNISRKDYFAALYVAKAHKSSIQASKFDDNDGFYQTLHLTDNDSLIISDTYFGNNKSMDLDIEVENGIFELCSFELNHSSEYNTKNGLLSALDCSFKDCQFIDNIDGLGNMVNTNIYNCEFLRNVNDIGNDKENLTIAGNSTITDSYFYKNENFADGDYAPGYGGALTIGQGDQGANVTISNSSFDANRANSGGAIGTTNGNLFLQNCNFLNNNAIVGRGGAVSGASEIKECIFEKDTAATSGGAVSAGTCFIENSIFKENKATEASAIFSTDDLTAEKCEFYSNNGESTIGVGGYVQYITSPYTLNMSNSILAGNSSGIYCYTTKGEITQTLFIDNGDYDIRSVENQSGWKGKLYIINCNILKYGDVWHADPVKITGDDLLCNSIVHQTNGSSLYKNCVFVYSEKAADGKTYYKDVSNENTIFEAGIQKGASGWGTDEDEIQMNLQLLPYLVNTGNNNYLPTSIISDFYGNDRISGDIVDIGILEYQFPKIYVEYNDTIRINDANPINIGDITSQNINLQIGITNSYNTSVNLDSIKINGISSTTANLVIPATTYVTHTIELNSIDYGQFSFPITLYFSKQDTIESYNITMSGNYKNTTNITSVQNKNEISIYPNPVSNTLQISHNNFLIKQIDIYDSVGNLRRSQQCNNLNLTKVVFEDLPAGMYLINIVDDNDKSILKKVIKK